MHFFPPFYKSKCRALSNFPTKSSYIMVRRRERRRQRESAENPAKFSNEKKEGEDFKFCRRTDDDVEERNRETEEEEEEEEDECDCVELSSQQRCVNSASIAHTARRLR